MLGFDLTVVVAVRDQEDHLGLLCTSLPSHLRALRLSFEMLLVDEGSSDNSLAVLSLLQSQVPEMAVVPGVAPGLGLLRGVELSRGRLLLLLSAKEARAAVESPGGRAALGLLLSRMRAGSDVAASPPYLLLRRALAPLFMGQLDGARTIGRLAPAVLRRARRGRLHVAQLGAGTALVQVRRWRQWLRGLRGLLSSRLFERPFARPFRLPRLAMRPRPLLRRVFGVPAQIGPPIAPVDHSS